MSAERLALDAALEYSKQLEGKIAAMNDEIQELRQRNSELRRFIDGVKDALSDRPGQDLGHHEAQCSSPMQSSPMQAQGFD